MTLAPMYSLSELENIDSRKDNILVEEVRSAFEKIQEGNRQPHDVTRASSAVGSGSPSVQRHNVMDLNTSSLIGSQQVDSSRAGGLILNTDYGEESCVRVDRSDIESITEMLKPYTKNCTNSSAASATSSSVRSRRSSSLLSSSSSPSLQQFAPVDDTSGVVQPPAAGTELMTLVDKVKATVTELEQWKRRACSLSAELRRYELAGKNEDDTAAKSDRSTTAVTELSSSTRTRRVSMPFGYQYPKAGKVSPSSLTQIVDDPMSLVTDRTLHRTSTAPAAPLGSIRQTTVVETPALLGRRRVAAPHQLHPSSVSSVDRVRKVSMPTLHPSFSTVQAL